MRERRGRQKYAPAKRGRRPTADSIRKLILKLAKGTGWGYTRILGELKKLGIQSVSRNTVKKFLRGNGYDPGPKRGLGTWDEFITIHASTLWQCDLLCERSLTPKGFQDLTVIAPFGLAIPMRITIVALTRCSHVRATRGFAENLVYRFESG